MAFKPLWLINLDGRAFDCQDQEKLNEEGFQEKGGPGNNVLSQHHLFFEFYTNLGKVKMY